MRHLSRDNLMLGRPNAIYAQEARGQRSFVESETLPMECSREAKATLEAAGVKFLGEVPGDPLFQYVELPSGWKKMPSEHSMWSYLVDEKGRTRASIFYKAAFYDRNARFSVDRRYHTEFDYDRFASKHVAITRVMDGKTEIYATEPRVVEGKESYEVSPEANAVAEQWLTEHYPEWKNPGAYWD